MRWKYHHQIVYAKFNLQVYYPSPYHRDAWHYGDTNIELISREIKEFCVIAPF